MVEARAHYRLGEISLTRGGFQWAVAHLEAARVLFVELKSAAWEEKAVGLLADARRRAEIPAPAKRTLPPGDTHSTDHKAA
jgi:hypothetical protein